MYTIHMHRHLVCENEEDGSHSQNPPLRNTHRATTSHMASKHMDRMDKWMSTSINDSTSSLKTGLSPRQQTADRMSRVTRGNYSCSKGAEDPLPCAAPRSGKPPAALVQASPRSRAAPRPATLVNPGGKIPIKRRRSAAHAHWEPSHAWPPSETEPTSRSPLLPLTSHSRFFSPILHTAEPIFKQETYGTKGSIHYRLDKGYKPWDATLTDRHTNRSSDVDGAAVFQSTLTTDRWVPSSGDKRPGTIAPLSYPSSSYILPPVSVPVSPRNRTSRKAYDRGYPTYTGSLRTPSYGDASFMTEPGPYAQQPFTAVGEPGAAAGGGGGGGSSPRGASRRSVASPRASQAKPSDILAQSDFEFFHSQKVSAAKHEVQAAESDLNSALPILKVTEDKINAMRKHILPDMAELKSFKSPPQAVKLIASALMVLYHDSPGEEHDWAKAVMRMSDANFAIEVHDYDIDSMKPEQVVRLGNELGIIAAQYVAGHTSHDDVYTSLASISKAVATVYDFLYHVHRYGSISNSLAPKRQVVEVKMVAMNRERALQESADKQAAKDAAEEQLKMDELRGVSRVSNAQVIKGMDTFGSIEGVSELDMSAMRRERALQDYRDTLKERSNQLHNSGIFSPHHEDRTDALDRSLKEINDNIADTPMPSLSSLGSFSNTYTVTL